jgi:hypothetical protein
MSFRLDIAKVIRNFNGVLLERVLTLSALDYRAS